MSDTIDTIDIVVPTVGRPILGVLLDALHRQGAEHVIVADDRPHPTDPPPVTGGVDGVVVVRSGGRGPAAARNAGWRTGSAPWVAFLDDDVVPSPTWLADLRHDIAAAGHDVGAVTGILRAPRPDGRRPTDPERNVIALETSTWITADMVVRRAALDQIDGFDERFRRAFREDTDLGLRLTNAGWRITSGTRTVTHPLRSGGWSVSVRAQRGNADDALMRRLHGPGWRERGHAPQGRLPRHVMTAVATVVAGLAAAARARTVGVIAGATAVVSVARFWWERARLGPATVTEWAQLAVSSTLIPFAATWYAATGWFRARRLAQEVPA